MDNCIIIQSKVAYDNPKNLLQVCACRMRSGVAQKKLVAVTVSQINHIILSPAWQWYPLKIYTRGAMITSCFDLHSTSWIIVEVFAMAEQRQKGSKGKSDMENALTRHKPQGCCRDPDCRHHYRRQRFYFSHFQIRENRLLYYSSVQYGSNARPFDHGDDDGKSYCRRKRRHDYCVRHADTTLPHYSWTTTTLCRKNERRGSKSKRVSNQ